MFRQLTAFLIFLAFVAQTLNGPFVLLDYYANTTAFAKNCINKAKPKMHCNGKCQMMKKMQEEEKKEQQSAEHRFEIQMAVLYSKSFYCTVTGPLTIVEKAFSHEIFCPMKDISLDVFHPPQA